MNSSASGTISTQGEVDEWTFFGRSGQSVTIFVNPGDVESPPPASPTLGFAHVKILDPQGNLVASASSASSGQTVRLGADLPRDGTYKIRVKAPASQPSSTGNYHLSLHNATIDVRPLVFDQREIGVLETPFSIDRWTFTANANQLIRFDLINSGLANLKFTLRGPNGSTVFTDLASDSDLVSLPFNGAYVLEAFTNGPRVGHLRLPDGRD